MRLATFSIGPRLTYGIATDHGFIDAGARLGPALADLSAVLKAGAIDQVRRLSSLAADHGVAEVQLLKPILNPGKILCVGVNYMGRNAEYKDASDQPKYPSLFVRFPASLVAHQESLIRPPESTQFDYEGEIAVVIGRRGRRIPQSEALAHLAGYTVCNEGTVRDWTKHGKFNATAGKNFERSGALGPFLTTPDEIPDAPLRVMTRVNGELRQDETTDRMMFPIPFLVSYISNFCTLEPGDIIVTGTPTGAGVRFDPPRYLVAGDRVEVEVPHVGILSNPVVDETAASAGTDLAE